MADCTWFSHLKSVIARGSHTFVIEDFLSKLRRMQAGSETEVFFSATFLARSNENSVKLELQIAVNMGFNSQSNSVYVNAYPYLRECPSELLNVPQANRHDQEQAKPKIPVKSQFCLLDECYHVLQSYEPMVGCYNGIGYPVESFLPLNIKSLLNDATRLLHSDESLAIRCSVEVNCGTELEVESTVPLESKLTLNVRLTPEKYPDMYLVSGETRLPCHKHMLAGCSVVFDAMFSHDSNEKKTNEVIITDVEPNALVKLLEFVYTDGVEDFEDLAHSLIYAADKYNMVNLKTLAVNEAVRTLDVTNVSDYITLGELVQSEYLMQRSFQFAHNNIEEVKKTNGWKALSQESLGKLFETVTKFGSL